LKRKTLNLWILLLIVSIIPAFLEDFRPGLYNSTVKLLRSPFTLLQEYRIQTDTFLTNWQKAVELTQNERNYNESLFYSSIYKTEYESLLRVVDSTDNRLLRMFPIVRLAGTRGIYRNERLLISSESPLPSAGYLVSPALGSVVGRIDDRYDDREGGPQMAEVIPFWSSDFTSRVACYKKNSNEEYDDLALVEKNRLINFNPSLEYQPGDRISIYDSELERYGWTVLGRVAPVYEHEIVERYAIDYELDRKSVLEENYFLVVE